jgi:hypothetical protein
MVRPDGIGALEEEEKEEEKEEKKNEETEEGATAAIHACKSVPPLAH